MEKPISLSLKDFLIRKMAVKLMMSEKTIDAVITHQFSSMHKAMLAGGNKSVELSGFGKFLFNEKKARKRLEFFYRLREMYETELENGKETLTETRKRNLTKKLESVNASIKSLKPVVYGIDKDIRGVEEQFITPEGIEEDD